MKNFIWIIMIALIMISCRDPNKKYYRTAPVENIYADVDSTVPEVPVENTPNIKEDQVLKQLPKRVDTVSFEFYSEIAGGTLTRRNQPDTIIITTGIYDGSQNAVINLSFLDQDLKVPNKYNTIDLTNYGGKKEEEGFFVSHYKTTVYSPPPYRKSTTVNAHIYFTDSEIFAVQVGFYIYYKSQLHADLIRGGDIKVARKHPVTSEYFTITVNSGGSLKYYAKKHGTTIQAIREINKMKSGDSKILVGQKLKIPNVPK